MLQTDRPVRNFRSFRVGWASKQGGPSGPDRRRRPEQIYRAIVERHFGKTYWTSVFRKSMSSVTCWPRKPAVTRLAAVRPETNRASRAPIRAGGCQNGAAAGSGRQGHEHEI